MYKEWPNVLYSDSTKHRNHGAEELVFLRLDSPFTKIGSLSSPSSPSLHNHCLVDYVCSSRHWKGNYASNAPFRSNLLQQLPSVDPRTIRWTPFTAKIQYPFVVEFGLPQTSLTTKRNQVQTNPARGKGPEGRRVSKTDTRL